MTTGRHPMELLARTARTFRHQAWRSVRRLAAVLLLPYFAWILFATVLNWQFLDLNRGMDGLRMSNAVQRFEL